MTTQVDRWLLIGVIALAPHLPIDYAVIIAVFCLIMACAVAFTDL